MDRGSLAALPLAQHRHEFPRLHVTTYRQVDDAQYATIGKGVGDQPSLLIAHGGGLQPNHGSLRAALKRPISFALARLLVGTICSASHALVPRARTFLRCRPSSIAVT